MMGSTMSGTRTPSFFWQRQVSSGSAGAPFADSGTPLESIDDYFLQLLDNRMAYLDGLYTLKQNWISGNSVAPERVAIESAKSVLSALKAVHSYLPSERFPHLMLAPLPSGGVGITFQLAAHRQLAILMHNSGQAEFETLKGDAYAEEAISVTTTGLLGETFLRLFFDLVN